MSEYRKLFFGRSATALSVLILALTLSGCAALYRSGVVSVPRQEISGAITIGSEWMEIVPPAPLNPYGTDQSLVIGYYNYDKNNWSDGEKGEILNLADGRKTRIEAFLYDDKGEIYELRLVGIGGVGGGIWFSRKGEVKWAGKPYFSEADYSGVRFPADRKFTKLKIRSEIPLESDRIEWAGENPK